MFEPSLMLLTMCGLEKISNKFKLVHPVLVFLKSLKCMVYCLPLWKKNPSKKQLKAPNFHDILARGEWM